MSIQMIFYYTNLYDICLEKEHIYYKQDVRNVDERLSKKLCFKCCFKLSGSTASLITSHISKLQINYVLFRTDNRYTYAYRSILLKNYGIKWS